MGARYGLPLLGFLASLTAVLIAAKRPDQLITLCRTDVVDMELGSGPQEVEVGDGLVLRLEPNEGGFSVLRGARTLLKFATPDLSSNITV